MVAVSERALIIGGFHAAAGGAVPAPARVQRLIDRRFYRRRYDVTELLAAFGAAMRAEVDLDRSTEALVAVAAETVQPRSVSVWLREPASSKEVRWPR